jgi:hypothetical protein
MALGLLGSRTGGENGLLDTRGGGAVGESGLLVA